MQICIKASTKYEHKPHANWHTYVKHKCINNALMTPYTQISLQHQNCAIYCQVGQTTSTSKIRPSLWHNNLTNLQTPTISSSTHCPRPNSHVFTFITIFSQSKILTIAMWRNAQCPGGSGRPHKKCHHLHTFQPKFTTTIFVHYCATTMFQNMG